MKRPILNRSSNGARSPSDTAADNVRPIGVRRTLASAASGVPGVAGSGSSGVVAGLGDQPRASIALPSSKSLASAVTAPLPAVGIAPDGAGKRR
jgi:hypothetical protein